MRFPSLLVSLIVMLGSITLISAIIIASSGIIITSYAEQKIANTTTAIAANRTAIATAANTTYRPLISTRGNFDINTSLLLANHNEIDYAAFDIPDLQVGKCTQIKSGIVKISK